jgi:general secretion pathway protein K
MKQRRGSVVIVVLVLVALGSMLMLRLIDDNSLELSLASREADRQRLRSEAWSEAELLVATLAEIRQIDSSRMHVPEQGWGDPHSYAGIGVRPGLTVTYTFEDESAKLSLPNLSLLDLTNLFEALGLTLRDAQTVSDALFTWMKPAYEAQDEQASSLAYERAGLSFHQPERSLRSFEELRSIGVVRNFFFDEDSKPKQLFHDFKRCVSLYQFSATNVNTCDPLVLKAKGFDERQIELTLAFRTDSSRRPSMSAPYFRSMTEYRSLVAGATNTAGLGTLCRLLRAHITLREGRAVHEVAVLVSFDTAATFPAAMADPDAEGAIERSTTGTSTPSIQSANKSKVGSSTTGTKTNNRQTAGTQNLTTGRSSLGGTSGTAGGSIQYPLPILEWGESSGRAELETTDAPRNRTTLTALSDSSPLQPENLTEAPNPRPTPGTTR